MKMRTKLYVSATLAALLVSSSIASTALSNSVPLRAGKYPVVQKKKDDKKAAAKKEDEKKKPYGDEKPFADIIKDMDEIKGVFTFYRKADENKIYLEITPEQFEKTFLFAGSIEQSVGERGLYSAQMGGHFPFQFKLVGKQVQWMVLNTTFTAQKDTPSDRATRRSFPTSILSLPRKFSRSHIRNEKVSSSICPT
jgi:hypothetical protein